ncbi:putative methyltransferase-domain-containing protein [Mycena crocata]|nr:putative methyltransferase-domain-containing protein [Mycena crocata]
MEPNPALRRGLIRLPPGSERVVDADEEVFLLYSKSTSTSSEPRGLGYVDSRTDTLTLSFDLKVPSIPNIGSRKYKRKSVARPVQDKTVEVQLLQDTTALRTRTGDTGSVVWKASVDFAQFILEQWHAKSPVSLLDAERLRDAHVLELGSGTGLLSLLLSPLVSQYTATDTEELLPLIRKNLALNFSGCHNVSVNELNWQTLHSAMPSRRSRIFPSPSPPIDLLLIVDCVYHPALLAPLLDTMDYVSTPEKTAVLVIMELRAEDVTREFLERWVGGGQWEVWRIDDDGSAGGIFGKDRPYAMWVGWKGRA